MKKERLIIPERDQSKIAKPRPNGVTFEQALIAVYNRYKDALKKLSKV